MVAHEPEGRVHRGRRAVAHEPVVHGTVVHGPLGDEPGTGEPAQVAEDSRGIVDPARLQALVHLNRYPAPGVLADVVEWLWAIEWDLPPGQVHEQDVLTHPCGNVSITHEPGGLEARVFGVQRSLYRRRLSGRGWVVAAKTRVGGLGALLPGPASELTDRSLPLEAALGPAAAGTVRAVLDGPDEPVRVKTLAEHLAEVVAAGDPARLAAAREVAAVARLAESDRSLRRLTDLATASGISSRTLQRMFAEHAGVPVTWVLRRYRLLDAAEAVRDGSPVVWADVAAAVGYTDQPHLVRDFHAALGLPPAEYARRQAALRDAAAPPD